MPIKEKLPNLQLISQALSFIGVAIFLLTFWLPKGFYLGGDAYFLGPYLPSLEVFFPYAGLGIFFAFLGHFLSKNPLLYTSGQVILLLFILVSITFLALFSRNPETSILFAILWATGILGSSVSEVFYIKAPWKRSLYFTGILLGLFALHFFPSWQVSAELLSMAALLGIVFLIQEESFPGRVLFSLFYVWVIFQSEQFWLIIFAILLFLFAKLWMPPSREKDQSKPLVLPMNALFGLLVWALIENDIQIRIFSDLNLPFLETWQIWIFGVGQGQFLTALQAYSPFFLIPEQLILPQSGMVLTLAEMGIFGILTILLLFAHPLFFHGKRAGLPLLLFMVFWILSSDIIGTENGIIWATVMLLGRNDQSVIRGRT